MRFPHGYGVHVLIDCRLWAKRPLQTSCSFQGASGSYVIYRKAPACALLESDVRKRTKGIGANEFQKRMSDQSGVFRPFYVVVYLRLFCNRLNRLMPAGRERSLR